MGGVAPIAYWRFFPMMAISGALIAAISSSSGRFRGGRYVRRSGSAAVERGRATITNNDGLDEATYYRGIAYGDIAERRRDQLGREAVSYSGPAYEEQGRLRPRRRNRIAGVAGAAVPAGRGARGLASAKPRHRAEHVPSR